MPGPGIDSVMSTFGRKSYSTNQSVEFGDRGLDSPNLTCVGPVLHIKINNYHFYL